MHFRLVDSKWDVELAGAVAADHSELRIVCPFIKERTAQRLLLAGQPQILNVITRFNLDDFYNGASDISALRLLLSHGAQIRGVRNLHAKLYLFGNSRVIVSSANLTEAALLRNHEFGFVADDPGILSHCRQYFDDLWQLAGTNLTEARLDAWKTQLDDALTQDTKAPVRVKFSDEGVDLHLPAPPSMLSPWVANAPQAFVKFFGEGHRRVPRTSQVVDIVDGCHRVCTYPKGKRPRKVQDGAIMFLARLVEDPNDIIIYGRAVAVQHEEGVDDATDAEIAARDWKARWPHYIRVHHPEILAGTLGHGIPLSELMNALRSDAFAPTQRNAAKGSGNTDPRRAYLQQAAVELTAEGYDWLNTRLDDAFTQFGKLPQSVLDQLT